MEGAEPTQPNPNAWLTGEAKRLGVPKKELLVLSANNDPYNCGTPAHLAAAEWFAGVYEGVGYRGVHLRRLHYRAYDAGVVNQEGERYPNTEEQWTALQNASRYARYLGLVDPEDFVDNRAPSPYLSVYDVPYIPHPIYELSPRSGLLDWYLPHVSTSLTGSAEPHIEHTVAGYYYDHSLQPNLIEIWSEKSGDNATLLPIAETFGINYCPGIGFQSVSNIRRMFRRVRTVGKPTCILYISDFDPAGSSMPVAVGRQTQFAFWQLEQLAAQEAPNVKLEPIALTQEQVMEWELPRKPIKEADRRKGIWEERFGGGAVEVDALAARYPGRLEQLVSERVESLQDPTLRRRMHEAAQEAERRVSIALEEVRERHRRDAEQTVSEFNEVAGRYRERLEAVSEQFEADVGHLRERFRQQREAFEEEVSSLVIELPEPPEAESPEDPLEDGWMYDSARDFTWQTEEFRRTQKRD